MSAARQRPFRRPATEPGASQRGTSEERTGSRSRAPGGRVTSTALAVLGAGVLVAGCTSNTPEASGGGGGGGGAARPHHGGGRKGAPGVPPPGHAHRWG